MGKEQKLKRKVSANADKLSKRDAEKQMQWKLLLISGSH